MKLKITEITHDLKRKSQCKLTCMMHLNQNLEENLYFKYIHYKAGRFKNK